MVTTAKVEDASVVMVVGMGKMVMNVMLVKAVEYVGIVTAKGLSGVVVGMVISDALNAVGQAL